ncbi:hypothetical protein [Bradyrhizobium sp. SEMIA]|uniref:hypothetical protein n=1 Tax=Bradyrhizobium sp. SEMIA TaxID=2597515 RepID=UPI0018A3E898|nr:hypothetical protein [Bradyrhizobium sp. SEMIA]QOG19144.1 hypothetical protein FOM02_19120 [Bradyrhizobium sp. SEMIA]
MTHARDMRIDLLGAHPRLFDPPEGDPERASGYPWCEQGWRDLLARMCGRIEAALREGETIHFSQVKEKFAGLRVYWRGDVSPETAAQINEAVALAQARAACTCEECGGVGQLYVHAGRYQTLCEAHAKGTVIPAEPGRLDVHIVRAANPSGHASRRYDRENDVFADVDPGDLGIEEE